MSKSSFTVPNFAAARCLESPLASDYVEIFRSSLIGSALPLLTIAIPTYKRPALLEQALASISKLEPTILFEVLVIDNDAEGLDGLVEAVVAKFQNLPISLIRNSHNVGMFGNWNRCLLLARTKWITILNDDDMLLPSFLQQLEVLIDNAPKNWAYVQLGYGVLDERVSDDLEKVSFSYTAKREVAVREVKLADLLACNTRAGSLAMVFDRQYAISVGGFDAEEYPTSDYRFAARLLANGRKAWENRSPAALYRVLQNESLKPEVMAKFIINDFYMLLDGIRFLSAPKIVVTFYARLRAIAYFYRLEKTWGVKPDRKTISELLKIDIRNNNFQSYSSRILSRLMRKFII